MLILHPGIRSFAKEWKKRSKSGKGKSAKAYKQSRGQANADNGEDNSSDGSYDSEDGGVKVAPSGADGLKKTGGMRVTRESVS